MPGANASAVKYDPQAEALTYARALIPNMSGTSTIGKRGNRRCIAVHREEFVLSEFFDELKQSWESIVLNPNFTLEWDYPSPLPVV
jgi:hypothetical protein